MLIVLAVYETGCGGQLRFKEKQNTPNPL